MQVGVPSGASRAPRVLLRTRGVSCRQRRILGNAGVVMLLTVPEAKPLARLLSAQVEGLRRVVTVPELAAAGGTAVRPPIHAHDLAFVQIDDRDIEGLDLRAWRVAFNGAERGCGQLQSISSSQGVHTEGRSACCRTT